MLVFEDYLQLWLVQLWLMDSVGRSCVSHSCRSPFLKGSEFVSLFVSEEGESISMSNSVCCLFPVSSVARGGGTDHRCRSDQLSPP